MKLHRRFFHRMPAIIMLVLFMFSTQVLWAQFLSAPAFPGAEGFGRYTTGVQRFEPSAWSFTGASPTPV